MTSFGISGAPARRLLFDRFWLCVVVWSVGMGVTGPRPCFADQYQDPGPPGTPYTFQEPALLKDLGSTKPGSLAIGDIGGKDDPSPPDGWLDVVFLNVDASDHKSARVFRNSRNWWSPTTPGLNGPWEYWLASPSSNLVPSRVVLADVDKQHGLDIVASLDDGSPGENQGTQVAILYNDGYGNFPTSQTITVTLAPYKCHLYGLAVADFNYPADPQHWPDILVVGNTLDFAGCTVSRAFLLRQSSLGIFEVEPAIDFPGNLDGLVATDVVAGRFNYFHDPNWPDAYVSFTVGTCPTGTEDNWVLSLINNGNWAPQVIGFDKIPMPGVPAQAIAAGPLRLPTYPYMDAAEGKNYGAFEPGLGYAYLNLSGDGTLTVQGANALGANSPFGVSMGTIDGGLKVDVALACQQIGPWNYGCAAIMFNFDEASAEFHHIIRYKVDAREGAIPAPNFIKVADMTRDGYKDLVTVCPGSVPYQLSVLVQPPPATNAPMGPEDFFWDDTEGPFW